jgi:hypothetical protein
MVAFCRNSYQTSRKAVVSDTKTIRLSFYKLNLCLTLSLSGYTLFVNMSIEFIFTSICLLAIVLFWFSPFEIKVEDEADECFSETSTR